MRSAVTGEPIPPRVNPEIFYEAVLERCMQDVVFASRSGQWRKRTGNYDDRFAFLWWVLKPARDGGTLPRFASAAEAAAFALAMPHRPDEWKDETNGD